MRYTYFISYWCNGPRDTDFENCIQKSDHEINSATAIRELETLIAEERGFKDNPVILNFQLLRTEPQ